MLRVPRPVRGVSDGSDVAMTALRDVRRTACSARLLRQFGALSCAKTKPRTHQTSARFSEHDLQSPQSHVAIFAMRDTGPVAGI
jgi:hypothetical protein